MRVRVSDQEKINKLVKSAASKLWKKAYSLCWHVFSEFEDLEQVGWVRLCESEKLRTIIAGDIKGKEGLIRTAAYRGMIDYVRSVIGREDVENCARHLQLYRTTRYMDYYGKVNADGMTLSPDDILDHMLPEPLYQATTEDAVIRNSLQAQISDFMNKRLSRRDKMIMDYLYQDGHTQKDAGKLFEVTESRISQVHKKAIKKIRKNLNG